MTPGALRSRRVSGPAALRLAHNGRTRCHATASPRSATSKRQCAPRRRCRPRHPVLELGRLLVRLNSRWRSVTRTSIFLTWHLAASASGVFGESAATRTMLLGRDQCAERCVSTVLSPPGGTSAAICRASRSSSLALRRSMVLRTLALARPLSSPVAAGAVRRVLRPGKRHVSRHAKSGYLLVPIVAYHALYHRLRPARAGVSPSLFSFSYVVFALHRQPIVSWAAYGILAVVGSWHALAGWRRMLSRDAKPARLQTRPWRAGWAAIVSALGLGLARLHAESPIPVWLAARYEPLL